MRVDLMKYMSDRMSDKDGKEISPGPVITISRLYGCPAKKVAKLLADKLTDKMRVKGATDPVWEYITKEIMSESAKELEVHPSKIKYVFEYEQKSLIDDILAAHSSKYYKSDRRIRNTIGRVIRNIATEGQKIIIGRGGVAITRDIPRSLHINLEAPLEWRTLRVSEKLDKSLEETEKIVEEVDKKRQLFRENFQGKGTDYTQFDLSLNCMTLSIEEIASIIAKAVEVRKLI